MKVSSSKNIMISIQASYEERLFFIIIIFLQKKTKVPR